MAGNGTGCVKLTRLRARDSRESFHYYPAMTKPDPYLARIEAFNRTRGGGVTITRGQNGYMLHLTDTQAPTARLQPTDSDDEMRLKFWSYRGRWQDVGNFGGIMLPLDQALEEVATNEIFWNWT